MLIHARHMAMDITTDRDCDRWMTTPEVAAYIGYSISHLARLRVEGGGPPHAKIGRGKQGQVRYRRSDVDTWMESHVRRSTSDAA